LALYLAREGFKQIKAKTYNRGAVATRYPIKTGTILLSNYNLKSGNQLGFR